MRCGLLLACVALSVATPAFSKEPTLREKLQGKWSKTNHPFSFEVRGDTWSEFKADKPLAAFNSGEVLFPPGKDYAVVKAKNGVILWLFSAGKNVVAVETFNPSGTLWEDGRVFYRHGTEQP
jgi:hypothetical protein